MDPLERHFHRRELLGGLRALEYNYFLSQFAYGMVGMFGVVYVFQMGQQWWQGLWLILVFYGIQRVIAIIVAPISGTLLERIGYRRVMTLSLLALVVKVMLLTVVNQYTDLVLILAALFGGIYLAAYHVSFEALFLEDNDNSKIGEQMGWLVMLQRMALVAAPFIAGIVVQGFGFATLFWLAVVILLVSIFPLLMMKHHQHTVNAFNPTKVVRFLERQPKMAAAVMCMSMALAVNEFFWPIFFLSLANGYAVLGAATSIVMLISSVLVVAVGKSYDRQLLQRGYPMITALAALFNVVRFLSQTFFVAASAELLGRFFSPMWWMKVRRYELSLGEKVDRVVFGVGHMWIESVGILLSLLFGVWLLVMTDNSWVVLAIISSVGIIVSGWLVRKE